MKRIPSSKVLLAFSLVAGCGGEPIADEAIELHSAELREHVAGEVLIQFRAGTTQEEKTGAREKAMASHLERVSDKKGDLELARIPPGRLVADAIRDLQSHPAVEFVEPNYIYTHQAAASDTYYANGSLWGMYGASTSPANQYGSNASAVWAADNTGSSAVYVGVIDEGIQLSHPDLTGQVWTNPLDGVDGLDNDGNGYVDDTNGWDFAGNDRTIYDGGSKGSLDDHGTHVAGTIGARANGAGVVGVNWNVTLISAKFLGRNGGTTANAIKAIDYLTNLKTRNGLNIVAINNSWGGGGFTQSLLDAIRRADAANIVFVVAAGNGGRDGQGDNNDTAPSYPAGYDSPNVISVAAITSAGARASFSNYGITSVDLGAPGSGIWSTTAFNTYSSYSGTSMATPHVTGAVALYASTHPGASVAQIRNALLTSTAATAALAGKTVSGGRLDIASMMTK